MAVRRQLQALFEEPQLSGIITVERPSSSVAATARLCPSPPSSPPAARVLSEPLPLSPPRRQGPLPADCAMFQCSGCWAVLGDSLHLCAEEKRLGVLVCYRVTSNAVWEDSLLIGLEGGLLGCAYNALSCHSCGLIVGFILYSAPHHLASLRGFFCLFKDSIFCYLLGKQTVTEASKVNFPVVTLKQKLQEMKEKLVEVHIRLELLMKKLKELQENNDVSDRQSSTSNAVALLPGYSVVRVD